MTWTLDRKRFAAALALFAAWVVFLAGMALVSSYRPTVRGANRQAPAASPGEAP